MDVSGSFAVFPDPIVEEPTVKKGWIFYTAISALGFLALTLLIILIYFGGNLLRRYLRKVFGIKRSASYDASTHLRPNNMVRSSRGKLPSQDNDYPPLPTNSNSLRPPRFARVPRASARASHEVIHNPMTYQSRHDLSTTV